MAKKKVTKKKSTKKTAKKTAAKSSTRTAKKTTKKPAAKKTTKKTAKKTVKKPAAKKAASKKVSKKKVVKKTTKKTAAKKTTKKAAAKKTTKKVAKPAAKKVAKKTTKKAPAAKADTKKAEAPKAEEKKPAPASKKKRSSKAKKPELKLPPRPLLLGPNGAKKITPLIPSGKKNKVEKSVLDNVTSRRTKTPLTKAQLEHYRMILLEKRAELLGDIQNLEEEALRSDSGRSSHTAQHLDEAGSESYEQSLNLNLAASDRERIIEIDAALERIKERTYGLCELTFEPIKKARLDEIPWTRHTIAAARELDRRSGHH